MTDIVIDAGRGVLILDGAEITCAIGRNSACLAADKREGNGCTPIGRWAVRGVLFRPGRVTPPAGLRLPWRWTRSNDGWSDDPRDPAYNRPVRHPHRFSAETLQRDDGLYDIVVPLGYNDAPPLPGLGSAIFLHCRITGRSTEGCVAIDASDLLDLLPRLSPGNRIDIRA